MHITEVIIDGFKSYAQRTVISGFDPQFNAITGLNGTGKSNILDAICFVLGISNLSQVRVGNLQELVYKQGQAGVTKASVTIIFNNSDKEGSPIGYEAHKQITVTRQVVIGGKNKYMINGSSVQQSQVQTLFHSVQLNVNNPHFLIMQGRITKVLNMKPEETLSMIEEAAGTKMFETKKQAAKKTIEKKQLKVEELTKCMDEEITPTLNNLRSERSTYLTWQSSNSELERLEMFMIASDFNDCQEKLNKSKLDKESNHAKLQELKDQELQYKADADECTNKIEEIERLREQEIEGGVIELKQKDNEASKELVKVNTLFTNHKEIMDNEQEAFALLQAQEKANIKTHKEKEAELDSLSISLEKKEQELIDAEQNASNMKEKYHNACAGMADESSTDLLSLPEQLALLEKKMRESQSLIRQGALKSEHVKKSLKSLQTASKEEEALHKSILKDEELIKKEILSIEKKLSNLSYDPKLESSLRLRLNELNAELGPIKDVIDSLMVKLEAQLNFYFKDPEKNFDRSRVKGLVAKLVRVNDKRMATALEITAGGRLHHVIVDNEITGKLLLQNGALRKRVTILPLNKISNRMTDPIKVKNAKTIALSKGYTANLAIELIGYDEEVKRAMEHVFGSTIICDSSDVANEICKTVKNRTVSLSGDSYDPSGTLTGGSTNNIGSLLSKINDLTSSQDILLAIENEIQAIISQLNILESEGEKVKVLKSQLEVKINDLEICREKLAECTFSKTHNDIKEFELQLEELSNDAKIHEKCQKDSKVEFEKLKSSDKNIKKQREEALKHLETEMKNSSKNSTKIKSEANDLRNKRDTLIAEVNASANELESFNTQLKKSQNQLVKMNEESVKLTSKLNATRSIYEAAKEELSELQKELNRCSKEIKALEVTREKSLNTSKKINLEIHKLTTSMKTWDKDVLTASKNIDEYLKSYPWIKSERSFFNVDGGEYDFKNCDIKECRSKLTTLKSNQDNISKNINKKVMGMIEKAETEYDDLSRKRKVILNDKSKIETVIDELEVKKTQALQSTWIKVNRDFGSIFSTLLPGTQAKLEPIEGKTVADGLEVKVAFNNVWKDSLTELSGGQRSLLALSLILALLLFKPAPMYILDEVDAALDLSHTQNIGLMLSTHFTSSQFIVVSLKEGMFNNANVIYRTKFVDGISVVTRSVVGGSSKLIEDGSKEDAPSKKKGKQASK